MYLNEKTKEYQDDQGEEVGLTEEEANSGIGTISIDGEYDTTYTIFLSDVSAEELNAISREDYSENNRAIDMLCDFYSCEKEDLEFEI